MNNLNNILALILGEKEKTDSERYFLTSICFIASVFLAFLCVFHMMLNLASAPVYLAGSSSIVLLGLYFYVKTAKNLFTPKLVLTVFGLVFLDFTWYSKFQSFGPVLYFIFAFGALVLWVWEGRALFFMLLLYAANIFVLFSIEYMDSSFAFTYPDIKTRSIDIYLSFSLYSSLLIFIMYIIKKDFINQREKAIKSDKLKSAFLANMSHEIRTPMNHIMGFSELLENEIDTQKRNQFLKIIQNSSTSLLKLINDLIDLSKIEADDLTLNCCDFSINEMFIELQAIYANQLLKKEKTNVILSYELPDNDYIICSDPLRIKQVISNLLNNALKFTASGKITYSCRKEGDELIFSVSDTGTGIPEEDKKIIFERFTKFNYSGMNTEGSGIGLSIVDKIVKLLKGRIWLESELGKGSNFHFSIPAHTATAVLTPMPVKSTQEEPKLADTQFRSAVLVVEDDTNCLYLIKEFLKTLNLNIEQVGDGKAAVEYVKLHPETLLVLMDIRLPLMDGYQATAAIREFNTKIPIIAQTANAMISDKEKALQVGCTDYLAKPLEPVKLQEMVRKYLKI